MHPDPLPPSEVADDRSALRALIADDPALAELYADGAFVLELGSELVPLVSPILRERATWYSLAPGDRIVVHVRRSLFAANCGNVAHNALLLQLLRDTPVVDGDEQRTKQTPVVSYQLYFDRLKDSERLGADYLAADISGIVELHRDHYPVGVLNNHYFCTLALRDYRTQETRLAFPSLEFHYLSQRAEGIDAAI